MWVCILFKTQASKKLITIQDCVPNDELLRSTYFSNQMNKLWYLLSMWASLSFQMIKDRIKSFIYDLFYQNQSVMKDTCECQ